MQTIQSYKILVFCTAVEQHSRNPVVQSWRFGISKPVHYFRSKCLWDLYSDSGLYYRYFSSEMFEASSAQIPMFSEKTFHCCDNTPTYLQIGLLYWNWLCRSWFANFTFYRYTLIQDFESCDHKDFKCQLNTYCVLPLWQITAKTLPLQFFRLDGVKRFS